MCKYCEQKFTWRPSVYVNLWLAAVVCAIQRRDMWRAGRERERRATPGRRWEKMLEWTNTRILANSTQLKSMWKPEAVAPNHWNTESRAMMVMALVPVPVSWLWGDLCPRQHWPQFSSLSWSLGCGEESWRLLSLAANENHVHVGKYKQMRRSVLMHGHCKVHECAFQTLGLIHKLAAWRLDWKQTGAGA